MDRRMFLGSVGAIALAPTAMLTPKPKMRCVDMRYIESLNRWVPDKWCVHSLFIACRLQYDLVGKDPTIDPTDIYVFYDICSWRSMEHCWIGYINEHASAATFQIKDIKMIKMVMMGTDEPQDYPHKSEFDSLHDYGHTVTHLVRELIKGRLCS